MTKKIYKTAQGNTIDLGTIMLKNSNVRAVGNMNVNARGDRLDNDNRVIETKSRQIQKQTAKTTVVGNTPVHTSTGKAKRARQSQTVKETESPAEEPAQINSIEEPARINSIAEPAPVEEAALAGGGLAAAIARSRVVQQEKEKTPRQLAQSIPGVRKI
jgi:hypothetical protein